MGDVLDDSGSPQIRSPTNLPRGLVGPTTPLGPASPGGRPGGSRASSQEVSVAAEAAEPREPRSPRLAVPPRPGKGPTKDDSSIDLVAKMTPIIHRIY